MGPSNKPRHNVKGRAASIAAAAASLDGSRKRTYEMDDSNEEIIDQAARKERKDKLRALAAEARRNEPVMSSKKQKRLDAYIQRKLKKEGRKELIASLAYVVVS